jgi:hypothetical protein
MALGGVKITTPKNHPQGHSDGFFVVGNQDLGFRHLS